MPVTIGVLRERAPGETRVSLVPEIADKLAASNVRVLLERGAGVSAQFPDAGFKKVEWAEDGHSILASADVLLTVHRSYLRALRPLDQVDDLRERGVPTDLRRPEHERARCVQRRADDGVAMPDPLLERHRPGKHLSALAVAQSLAFSH